MVCISSALGLSLLKVNLAYKVPKESRIVHQVITGLQFINHKVVKEQCVRYTYDLLRYIICVYIYTVYMSYLVHLRLETVNVSSLARFRQ